MTKQMQVTRNIEDHEESKLLAMCVFRDVHKLNSRENQDFNINDAIIILLEENTDELFHNPGMGRLSGMTLTCRSYLKK